MKAGQVVAGKYRLDARLGIGGMGEVWKATHSGTEREFALKFMHPHVATSATARQRFTREAKVSAKINHPNVIDIFDVGEVDDGILFLAMELLEGVSLADALHASQPLSVLEFLTVVLDTSRALAAAHAAGVVHRDLKPGNIFLQRDRATGFASAKILDFGISKMSGEEHTKTGAVLGSPRYMSPEQTRSAASVDHRSDLWAMGVILFEGLTGTWPHEGDSFSSLVVAICTQPPTSIDKMVPGLPEPLRAIVRDCLKPLDQRLGSATELATRIASVLTDPVFERLPLPRPLHAPSDSIRTVTSVRVRPPLLTTSSGGAVASESLRTTHQTQPQAAPEAAPPAPESLRTTQQRANAQPSYDGAASGPKPRAASQPSYDGAASGPKPRAPSEPYEEDATQVRPQLVRVEPPAPAAEAVTMGGAPPYPPAQPVAPPQPTGPVFKPNLKTIPLKDSAAMYAELARSGVLGQSPPSSAALPSASAVAGPAPAFTQSNPGAPPAPTFGPAPGFTQSNPGVPSPPSPQAAAPRPPDPLLGTVSRNNFETRADSLSSPPQMPPFTPVPAQMAAGAPPRTSGGKALGVVVAILSVMLVGIIVALVAVLRSGPPSTALADTGDPRPAASAPPSASATTVVSEAPPVTATAAPIEPAPTAAPSAPATSAPTAAPAGPRPTSRPGQPGKSPSKVKQLGSGL